MDSATGVGQVRRPAAAGEEAQPRLRPRGGQLGRDGTSIDPTDYDLEARKFNIGKEKQKLDANIERQ